MISLIKTIRLNFDVLSFSFFLSKYKNIILIYYQLLRYALEIKEKLYLCKKYTFSKKKLNLKTYVLKLYKLYSMYKTVYLNV